MTSQRAECLCTQPSRCVKAQGHGRLVVQPGTMLWLCGYRPLRIHSTGGIWMCPKQGLTAVSELSRSEIETDMICIISFLHYISSWVGCLSCYTTYPKNLPNLPPHSAFHRITLLATSIFFQLFPRHSESCQHLENLLGPEWCCRITNTNISYRRTEEGSWAPWYWAMLCFNKFKEFPSYPGGHPFIQIIFANISYELTL